MGHHVAGRARITIPVPGPANFLRGVVNPEVADPGIQQTLAHADAGKAGADHQGIQGFGFYRFAHISMLPQSGGAFQRGLPGLCRVRR